MELGIANYAAIVVICYLVGMTAKATTLENKYIPVVVGITGAILGVVGMYVVADFPAANILEALAVGIVSGLASTGLDQLSKIPTKE